ERPLELVLRLLMSLGETREVRFTLRECPCSGLGVLACIGELLGIALLEHVELELQAVDARAERGRLLPFLGERALQALARRPAPPARSASRSAGVRAAASACWRASASCLA